MPNESNVCNTSSFALCAPVPLANGDREEEKEKNSTNMKTNIQLQQA